MMKLFKIAALAGIAIIALGYSFGYFSGKGHGPNDGLGGYVILILGWATVTSVWYKLWQ